MNPFPWWMKTVLVLMVLLLLAGGAWFYRTQEKQMRLGAEQELQVVANLKVKQIADWRDDQLAEGKEISMNTFFVEEVARWLVNPQEKDYESIRLRLYIRQVHYSYFNALLVDAEGKVRLSLRKGEEDLTSDTLSTLASAYRERQPVLTDLHVCNVDHQPHISVVAPLLPNAEPDSKPIGAVIFVNDASKFLYPLIQSWPTISKTAETLIIKRNDDHVLYLNELRHQKGTALKFRIPMTQKDLPAVMAAMGKRGIVEGIDYRGVKVLAALEAIPNSPWLMVAKVDKSEALAVWRFRSILLILAISGLAGLVAAGGLFFWQRSEKAHYRALYRSEAARRAIEERYGITIRSIGDGVIATDAQGRVELMNPVAESLTGWREDEAKGRPLEEVFRIVNEDTREEMENPAARVMREGQIVGLANHTLLIAKDGRERPIADSGAPIRDAHGALAGVVLVFRDQTKERAARKALQESEERFRGVAESAGEWIWEIDANGLFTYSSPAIERLLGCKPDELVGKKHFYDLFAPADKEALQKTVFQILSEKNPFHGLVLANLHQRDGRLIIIESSGEPILDERGGLAGYRGVSLDITDRVKAEEEIRRANRVYAVISQINQLVVRTWDQDAIFSGACRIAIEHGKFRMAWVGLLEESRQEIRPVAWSGVEDGYLQIIPTISIRDVPEGRGPVGTAFREGKCSICNDIASDPRMAPWREQALKRGYRSCISLPIVVRGEIRGAFTIYAAEPFFFSESETRLLEEVTGDISYALQTIEEKNRREEAEEALLASEAKFRHTLDAMLEGCQILGFDWRYIYLNDIAERHGRRPKEELLGKVFMHVWPGIETSRLFALMRQCMEHRIPQSFENEFAFPDGSTGVFELKIYPVPEGIAVLSIDITERKKAEEEQKNLQAQLAHAQKMESIGRLAGGVAHDFNNMLQTILGCTELALEETPGDSPAHEFLMEVHKAAERSAELTRRLLAFARKQTIAPRVLDLGDTVAGMLKMLKRLIGEDISLAWVPGGDLWPIKIDPAQVDQILANLCVNARDAIAGVGKITIETSNASFDEAYCADHAGFLPGEYVLLAVSDTGCGMEKGVLDHLFELFYTTKGIGKGTGLGLATVYGIVKQNQGFINVYSEPGKGTTLKIYFPRYAGEDAAAGVDTGICEPAQGGTETILLVEDELAILELGKFMLTNLGYTVLAAGTPAEALRMAKEKDGDIHLLITDVVMPEMTGRDLAAQLTAERPGLRVLFMSGYTANAIAHHGVLDEGVQFIQKPFSIKALAAKVRETLRRD